MAGSSQAPEDWVGREVHLRYIDADAPRSLECTLSEVGERGVCVVSGEETSFFPWTSVVRLDLGPGPLARSRRSG